MWLQYNYVYSEDSLILTLHKQKRVYGYTSLTLFCGECGNYYFHKKGLGAKFHIWSNTCPFGIWYGRHHKIYHFINWVTLTDYVRLANKDSEMLSQPSQILRHQIIRCISRAIKFFTIGCAQQFTIYKTKIHRLH